ncbi:hypothetical protein Pla110_32470 [Polystyrenella longa]|uniref:DUF3299 domain-containing protein n=1 Tax=Polystyrenella longa TaxID=2528007 RepID=A0A518CQL6_9PLAN|nr:hypothetical protein [Polystyrenella longa]QDU81505.1 hypothetical protein Pla110_32470 [Polystyrenella longa]
MKYHLNLLILGGMLCYFCGCEQNIDTSKYESPASATSAAPVMTPGDLPLSEETEEKAFEKVFPSPEEVEVMQELLPEKQGGKNSGSEDKPNEEPASSEEDSTPDTSQSASSAPLENDEVTSEEVSEQSSSEPTVSAVSIATNIQEESILSREPVMAPRPEAVIELRKIKLLVEENSFKKVGKEKALQISYDDIDLLKVLNMEPVPLDAVDHFPDWLMMLDGQRIRIRGFMYPPFQETGIEKFLLARDNDICCFGRDPKIYDIIRVKLKEGTTTNYIPNRPFDVVGRFHITPEAWDDDKLLKLYQIDEAVIIQK